MQSSACKLLFEERWIEYGFFKFCGTWTIDKSGPVNLRVQAPPQNTTTRKLISIGTNCGKQSFIFRLPATRLNHVNSNMYKCCGCTDYVSPWVYGCTAGVLYRLCSRTLTAIVFAIFSSGRLANKKVGINLNNKNRVCTTIPIWSFVTCLGIPFDKFGRYSIFGW